MIVLARLRDLLADLDSDKASARLMARDLGLPVARINFDGTAANVWDSLLDVAHQQGQISALIALASREAFRGLAPQLAEILRQYQQAQPAATPDGEAKLLAKYQAWVQQEHDQIQILGMNRPVPLSSIYTDVWLRDRETFGRAYAPEALQEQFLQWRRNEGKGARRDGLTVAQQERRLFIMGQPGAGKSTLMRHLALQAAQGEGGLPLLPVFLSIKALADSGQELLDFLVQEVEIGCAAECRDWVGRLLREGQVLVLLDGLDEASRSDGDRSRMRQMIENFGRRFRHSQLVVTCRVAATDYLFQGFTYVEVADFTPKQIETFVTNWFAAEAPETGRAMLRELDQTEQKGIADLTKTPLLLALLCLAYKAEGKFSQRRAELYQRAFNLLLAEWDRERAVERGEWLYGELAPGRREALFSQVAYQTFKDGVYFMPQAVLEGLLLDYLVTVPGMPARIDVDGAGVLKAIMAQHGLFVERTQVLFSFSHLTFQEYFAAKYIADNVAEGTLQELVAHYHEDRWREVFLLVASLLPRGETFFDLFLAALAQPMAADGELVALLHQAQRATSYESLAGRQPAAIRSWYLSRDLARTRALDLDLARALDLDLDFARARARARDLARDREDDLDLVLDTVLVAFYKAARVVAHYEADKRQRVSEVMPPLQRSLDKTVAVADRLQLPALAALLRQQPWPAAAAPDAAWQTFVAMLAAALRQRGFNLERELTRQQWRVVETYLQGNHLLLDCLNLAYVRDRAAIEAHMLLPPPTSE